MVHSRRCAFPVSWAQEKWSTGPFFNLRLRMVKSHNASTFDSCCYFTLVLAEVPVTRRGRIFPRSEMKRLRSSVSL